MLRFGNGSFWPLQCKNDLCLHVLWMAQTGSQIDCDLRSCYVRRKYSVQKEWGWDRVLHHMTPLDAQFEICEKLKWEKYFALLLVLFIKNKKIKDPGSLRITSSQLWFCKSSSTGKRRDHSGWLIIPKIRWCQRLYSWEIITFLLLHFPGGLQWCSR